MTYKGKVKDGVVVLDQGISLADGTEVRVEPVAPRVETLGKRLMKYAGNWTFAKSKILGILWAF